MVQSIIVTYDGQVLKPEQPLDLELDKQYRITITPTDGIIRNEQRAFLPRHGVCASLLNWRGHYCARRLRIISVTAADL